MKRKNYAARLAFFVSLYVLVPMYLLIVLLAIYADIELREFQLVYLINYFLLLVLCCTGGFILLLGCFSIVFKAQKYEETNDYYIQNKRIKLKKDNLKEIICGKFGKLFFVDFVPIKDSVWVSCRLKYYFKTYEEFVNFIMKNSLLDRLNPVCKESYIKTHYFRSIKIDENKKITFRLYPCPCCYNYTYTTKPGGTYYICPVCFFEDEKEALDNPDQVFSCNKVSLNEARKNFKEFKACKEDMKEHVREPYPFEIPRN